MFNLSKKYHHILILIVILTLNLSCGDDSPTEPEDSVQVVNENVVVAETQEYSQPQVDTTSLVYSTSDTIPVVTVGDVLIIQDTVGYAKKILSIDTTANEITMNTENATLTDIFKNVTIDTTFKFGISPSQIKSSKNIKATSLLDGISIVNGGIAFDHVEIYNGDVSGTDVVLTIQRGNILFDPDIDFKSKIENSKIVTAQFIASGNLTIDLDIELNSSGPFFYEPDPITLLQVQHGGWYLIGKLPVYIEVILSFDAGFSASLDQAGSTTFGADNSSSVSVGAKYENNTWSPVWVPNNILNAHTPVIANNIESHIEVYIKPRVDLIIYTVVGPYMDFKPYLGLDQNITLNPLCWDRQLYGGIKGSVGIQGEFLDYELFDYNKEYFSVETEIYEVNDCLNNTDDSSVTDIDGNVYKTIIIGDQIWMAENLSVTHYRNGDSIPNVTDNGIWGSLTTGAYSDYNHDVNNAATYGRLYNWYAIDDSRNIAPEGWHVATDDEWKQLEMYLGMSQADADVIGIRGTDEGGKLKEVGTTHWNSPNSATNESGFSALPGGDRDLNGTFDEVGFFAYFWSSTEKNTGYAWSRYLRNTSTQISRSSGDNKPFGFSVRCVKD